MVQRGIHFVGEPKEEKYGTVAVFEDLYGNLWDLLEPNDTNSAVDQQSLHPDTINK